MLKPRSQAVPSRGGIVLSQQQGSSESTRGHGTFMLVGLYRVPDRELNVRRVAERTGAKLVAAAAAAGLVLTPAFATGMQGKKRPSAIAVSFDPISSFTPANADPKLAAALAGKGLPLTDFKF